MERELEFFVEEGVVVQAWREYVDETMDLVGSPRHPMVDFAKVGAAEGLVRARLLPPADVAGGLWRLDAEEDPAVTQFRALLAADAEWLRELADPVVLKSRLRAHDPRVRRGTSVPEAAVLTVLLTAEGRFDEATSILPDTSEYIQADRLATWVERRRAARHR